MKFSIGTTVKIAFYSTLIESVIGVIICALYVLFHFCTITVSCPGTGKLQQVAYVFYTTYLREKDGCNVTRENTTMPEIMSNENKLTEPHIIFFWQILLLLLYLAWVGSALLLQQVEKKSRSAIPWLFVTFLVIMTDFAASAISLTDYQYDEMGGFSCPLEKEWTGPRKTWTTTILFLYFCRGGVIWMLNLWGFLTVTAYIIEAGKKVFPATPQVQTNKNPLTDYWATPPGHTLDLEERNMPELKTFSQEGRHSEQQSNSNYQPPSSHYQPPSSHYQPPTTHDQPPTGYYQPPTSHYQPPATHYQPPTSHYQHPTSHHQPSTSHYQPPTNPSKSPSIDHQPLSSQAPVQTNRQGNSDGLRRPQSFVERIKNAENSDSSNPLARDSQIWSYTSPGVRKELQSRGENLRPNQPDKDVDSAFNFLETYSIKEEGPNKPETENKKSYSQYLSNPQERVPEVTQGIPRAKIPASSSRPSSAETGQKSRGPGSRYFVPLKN